jgi:serine/threonine protein kinase
MLGSGGFGVTYVAHDTKRGRKYALKEYFPYDFAARGSDGTVSSRPDCEMQFDLGLKSFITEAMTLRDLPDQEGLVKVRAAFEKFGTAYCLMEYIEGDPVDRMVPRMLRRYGHIPEEIIRQFTVSIASALAALHDNKLIHRDVKPGNVMIRRDGQPILIDFGAARSLKTRKASVSMFTRRYAAIEQFPLEMTNAQTAMREGPWSDLFALSVMLYEMATGTLPPDALTRLQAMQADSRDPYVPAREVLAESGGGPGYSAALLTLIDTGCSLLPQDRPGDAAAYLALMGETLVGGQGRGRARAHFGVAERLRDLGEVLVNSGTAMSRLGTGSAGAAGGQASALMGAIKGGSVWTRIRDFLRGHGALAMVGLIVLLALVVVALGMAGWL